MILAAPVVTQSNSAESFPGTSIVVRALSTYVADRSFSVRDQASRRPLYLRGGKRRLMHHR